MNITILAHGSRGDVQPYLALALGLACAGHHVRLAAPELFREMVEGYTAVESAGSLEFAGLPGDPLQLMREAAAPSPFLAVLPGPVRIPLTVIHFVLPVVRQLINQSRHACRDADLVIHTLLTAVIGHQIARERGIPDISALVFPVILPTTTFPNPLFRPWPGWAHRLGERAGSFSPRYNYLTHREFNRVFWLGSRIAINLLRRRDPSIHPISEWPFGAMEAIPPEACPPHPVPILYGISRHALPCPEEWISGITETVRKQTSCGRMTGYWFLDAPPGWQPPIELVKFLDSGPAPVFIGFGSLVPRDTNRLARASVEALHHAGRRGVILSGWAGLRPGDLPETVYLIREIPFDWLFPRLAGAIHHGGMGTTAAALRAGIPQAAVPFTFDQPFWGRQIHALGVGPRPIPRRQLTAERLASTIRSMVDDTTMHQAAAHLGEQVRAEDGVGNAVKLIEGELFDPPR